MNEEKPSSPYPVPIRGSLSADHEKYNHPVVAKGPKTQDMQTRILLFGIVFFIVVAVGFAYFAGLGHYFQK